MSEKEGKIELLNSVLGITREQLSRSMNLNAELEALLGAERERSAYLEKKLSELSENSKK
jgi:hypothetical protein